MYTLLYLKCITNRHLLHSTGNSVQCYVAAWTGGDFGGEWIPVYVRLSPFAIHPKLSHFNWLYSNTKKKKFLKGGEYQSTTISSLSSNFRHFLPSYGMTQGLYKLAMGKGIWPTFFLFQYSILHLFSPPAIMFL